MKIENFISSSNLLCWNIVLKGNSAKSMTTDKDGNLKIRLPVTAKEHQQVQRKETARTILLSALPDEHMGDFYHMIDARDIWNAIKARFGGNVESKKLQKSLLKQKFEEFKISKEEGLDKGYDKMQKILSQMNTIKIKPEPEDVNTKFLRGLPPSWSGITLILKTKGGLEYISFDDLYNKLKFLEIDTKGYSSSSSTLSNAAFVSTAGSSQGKLSYQELGNGGYGGYTTTLSASHGSSSSKGSSKSICSVVDDVIYSFFANHEIDQQLVYEDLDQMNKEEFKEYDLKHQMAMLSIKVHRFDKKHDRKIKFNGRENAWFDKKLVKCFNCKKMGHFSRECRAQGGQNINNYQKYKEAGKDGTDSKAMVVVDGNAESEEEVVSTDEIIPAGGSVVATAVSPQSETEFAFVGLSTEAHKHDVKSLEKQIKCHQTNQLAYKEKIKVLSYEIKEKYNILEYRQKLIDQATHEKQDLMTKLDNKLANQAKWNNNGTNMYKLIDSSMSVRTKRGLGLDKYLGEGELGIDDSKFSIFHTNSDELEGQPINNRFALVDYMKTVPPPLTGNYMPPFNIPDIDESQMVYGKKTIESSEIKTNNDSISYSDDSVLFDFSDSVFAPVSESSDTIVIDCARQEGFPSVCRLETDVKSSKPLCNKFGSFNKESHFRKHKSIASKSCYACGSYLHLIKDCDFHEQTFAKRNAKGKGILKSRPTGKPVNPNRLKPTSAGRQKPVSAGRPNTISAGRPNQFSADQPNPVSVGQPNTVFAGDGILGPRPLNFQPKNTMFTVCAAARHQVTPKTSNLLSVKRIFKYLTTYPKLGLWYPQDSPFDLEAFFDGDYTGAHGDRKSTTGGSEYVAAASCCGQLWLLVTSVDRVIFCWLIVIPAGDLVPAGLASEVSLPDSVKGLMATIDGTAYTVTKASIRGALQLDDLNAIDTLTTAEIFDGLRAIGYPTDGKFINIAIALICLSTGRKYNFSNMIFTVTKKIFANMRHYQGPDMPLLAHMLNQGEPALVQAQPQEVSLPPPSPVVEPHPLTDPMPSPPRPDIPSSSRTYEPVQETITSLIRDDDTGGGSFPERPPSPSLVTLTRSPTVGITEEPLTLNSLLALFPTCLQRIATLEAELKATKILHRDAVVLFALHDPSASTTPSKPVNQEQSLEQEISPTTLDAFLTLSQSKTRARAAKIIYKRLKKQQSSSGLDFTDAAIPAAGRVSASDVDPAVGISTGGADPAVVISAGGANPAVVVSTGGADSAGIFISAGVSVAAGPSVPSATLSPIRDPAKGKAVATPSSPITAPTDKELADQQAAILEAERQELLEQELKQSLDAEQVYLDSLLIAPNLTNEEWIGLVDQVQANLTLSAELLGADVSEDTFSVRMVELMKKRRKAIAEMKAKAKRDKPLTPAQQKEYMRAFNVYNKIRRAVDLATAKDHHQHLKRSGETLESLESKKLKSSHSTEQSAELQETTYVYAGATGAAGDPISVVPSVHAVPSISAASSIPVETPIATGVSTTVDVSESAKQAVPLRKTSRKNSMARRRTLSRPSQSESTALPFDEDDSKAEFKKYLRQVSDDDEPAELVSLSLISDIPIRIGLGLWSDLWMLITAREDRDASIIWDDQDQWEIRSWRLYALPVIHVLETEAGDIMYMFVDKKYLILPATIQRKLNHGLEID
uniref:Ribonuclease H-like domain-containing protein n=1 Tax=Tanacetum cinerariifolium TaxID=118510 RepID=A0A6L2KJY0_TANCI|nr:ribonuclease H-like domain-containing protein [Tanacetum cinerariifolium]